MKNYLIFISICLLSIASLPTAYANETPHIVPTLNCPAGQTCCPSEVYCSYSEGCGDTGSWLANGQGNAFQGIKRFILSGISASISNPKNKTYWIYCEYGDVKLTDAEYKLNGDWEYSGFGNINAKCKSGDPINCTLSKSTAAKASSFSLPMIDTQHADRSASS
jgi:hypothetical protein